MKRIKIMLVCIITFAMLGGALAFEAKRFSNIYCIRAASLGEGTCTGSFIGRTTNAAFAGTYFYITSTNNGANCTHTLCLPPSVKLTIE